MLNPSHIRRDFPVLDQRVHGRRLVYLDSAATSQKPRAVLDAVLHYYERDNANVHRGVHALAERATVAYENARRQVARFVNVAPEQLIWTKGTTEAVNLVAHSWARKNLRPGDEIIVSRMEHHSNLVPWQLAAQDTGAKIRVWEPTADFRLEVGDLRALLNERSRLVAVTHMSNVLGTINPVAEVCRAARSAGALVFVDGAQAVPHLPVDLAALDVDFYAFSAHKMLGPTGIGALTGKRELLEAMAPFHGGGEMISEVTMERSTYKPLPYKFEAGTPPIAAAVGFGAAAEYLTALGMNEVAAHEAEITRYALEALQKVGGVTVFGPPTGRGGAVSFAVDGIHPHDLATILDREGVAVRAGHHCAQPLMTWLGVPATTRASFYVYNDNEDVDALVQAVEKAKTIFGTAGQPA